MFSSTYSSVIPSIRLIFNILLEHNISNVSNLLRFGTVAVQVSHPYRCVHRTSYWFLNVLDDNHVRMRNQSRISVIPIDKLPIDSTRWYIGTNCYYGDWQLLCWRIVLYGNELCCYGQVTCRWKLRGRDEIFDWPLIKNQKHFDDQNGFLSDPNASITPFLYVHAYWKNVASSYFFLLFNFFFFYSYRS